MAYYDTSTRKKGKRGGFYFRPSGTHTVQTDVGVTDPSEYGLEGLDEMVKGIAERQSVEDMARQNVFGKTLVPLDPEDPRSPMVSGGNIPARSGYLGGMRELESQEDIAQTGLRGEEVRAQGARDVATETARAAIEAATLRAQGAKDVAGIQAKGAKEVAGMRLSPEEDYTSERANVFKTLMTAVDPITGERLYTPEQASAYANAAITGESIRKPAPDYSRPITPGISAGAAPSAEGLPNPAQHAGRRIQLADGTILRSNGSTWVRE